MQRPAFIAAFELEQALWLKHPGPAPGQQAAQQAQQGAPRGISMPYLRELRELYECLSPKVRGLGGATKSHGARFSFLASALLELSF